MSQFRGWSPASRLAGAVTATAAVAVFAGASSSALGDESQGESLPGVADYAQAMQGQPAGDGTEPTTSVEREESTTAYADLSDQEAIQVLKDEFENTVSAELFPEPDIPAGAEVQYLDRFTARVGQDVTSDSDLPTTQAAPLSPDEVGQNSLLQSSFPLFAREAGDLEPVDGDLDVAGDSYEVSNASVETEIPADLGEGIEIPALSGVPHAGTGDVEVTPSSVGTGAPIQTHDKLLYPNSDVDTDMMVAPTPTGVEIFYQLRSAASPESQSLDFDLPAGATLSSTPDGGARVLMAGETQLVVDPPVAWDAANQAVAVSYEIEGDALNVLIDHQGRDELLYPIMVDPHVLDNYPLGGANQNPQPEFWHWESSNPNDFNSFYQLGDGLTNRAKAEQAGGRWFAAGSYTQWVVSSIRASFVEEVAYYNFDHVPTWPGTCTFMGIWSNGGWAYGGTWNNADGAYVPGYGKQLCNNRSHDTQYVWVGDNGSSDGDGGDPEAADGSIGIFALSSQQGTRYDNASSVVRGVDVWRGDKNVPTIASAPSEAWTSNPTVAVADAGLGVSGVGVYEMVNGQQNWVGGGGPTCGGNEYHRSVCPASAVLPIVDHRTPEGRRTLCAQSFDMVYNGSYPWCWTARIDRSPPALTLGGPLAAIPSDQELTAPSQLTIAATDGSTASPSSERSGVASIRVYVDGNTAYSDSPGCGSGSCPMDRTWTMDPAAYPDGPHQVTVVATDSAGQQATRGFQVEVALPPGPIPGADVGTPLVGPDGKALACGSSGPTTGTGLGAPPPAPSEPADAEPGGAYPEEVHAGLSLRPVCASGSGDGTTRSLDGNGQVKWVHDDA